MISNYFNKVLLIGSGVMGESFLHHINRSHSVNLTVINHPEHRTHASLDCTTVKDVDQLSGKKFDIIIIGVSLKGFEWAVSCLRHLKETPVIILTKGLCSDQSILTLTEYAALNASWSYNFFHQIAGPCIASDLLLTSYPLHLVISGAHSDRISEEFNTKNVKMIPTQDTVTISYCSALKNIYSIAINSIKNESSKALFFSQVLSELYEIIKNIQQSVDPTFNIVAAGDLWITVKQGRNGKFGRLIAEEGSLLKAKEIMKDQTIEGIELAKSIHDNWMKSSMLTQYPIATEWIKVLNY